ncbi:MAG: adenine phosphoribosyltransferase [Frankiaceae bacterium]|nr:adenine phosphoribosyltransferase [Frankiaceae bacterium]
MPARVRGPVDLDALLRSRIVDVPDFPLPGVVFKDISPLLADHVAFAGAVDAIIAHWRGPDGSGTVDKVVGVEARGFILAAPVAYHFGAGFVPVRKQGKLPLATHEEEYDLEYGTNVLQVHQDAFEPGDRVLIVDDVLATGGTAAAAARLVAAAGADLVGLSVLLELEFLAGRQAFTVAQPGVDVHALLTY